MKKILNDFVLFCYLRLNQSDEDKQPLLKC